MASSLLVSEDALSASLVLLQPTSILVTLSISLLPGVLLGTWLNERGRAASVTLETIIRRKESMQRSWMRTVRTVLLERAAGDWPAGAAAA